MKKEILKIIVLGIWSLLAGIGLYFVVMFIDSDYRVLVRPNFYNGKFGYCPIKFVDEVCWGKSLNAMNKIKKRKDVQSVSMVYGNFTKDPEKVDHAWFMYVTRDNVVHMEDPMNGRKWIVEYED